MNAVSTIAIILSVISLTFAVIQWTTKHRPYIGIVDIRWDTIEGEYVVSGTALPDVVRCKLKNVGEAPAKAIYVTGAIQAFGFGQESDKETIERRDLGILFPGQEAELVLSFPMNANGVVQGFAGNYGVVEIDTNIGYESNALLLWHRRHGTKQRLAIIQHTDSWHALSGGHYS